MQNAFCPDLDAGASRADEPTSRRRRSVSGPANHRQLGRPRDLFGQVGGLGRAVGRDMHVLIGAGEPDHRERADGVALVGASGAPDLAQLHPVEEAQRVALVPTQTRLIRST